MIPKVQRLSTADGNANIDPDADIVIIDRSSGGSAVFTLPDGTDKTDDGHAINVCAIMTGAGSIGEATVTPTNFIDASSNLHSPDSPLQCGAGLYWNAAKGAWALAGPVYNWEQT